MKALASGVFYAVLYTAAGAALLWAGTSKGINFYAFAGLCLLALALWEGRTALRAYRRKQCPGRHPTMNLAYVLLALCSIARAIAEPTGFNVGIAVCWSILGVLYAVKFAREIRAEDREKEETS